MAHKTLGKFAREQRESRNSTALSKIDPKLLKEVVDGYRQGINVTVIARWLRDEHGMVDMSVPKIRYHMELHGIGWGEAASEQGSLA